MQRLLVCCLLVGGIAAAAAGTSFGRAQRAADTAKSISVNGYTRNIVYAVSDAAAPQAGRPLVIQLHGDGGNLGISEAWRSAVLSDANGAVFLSAQGRNNIPAAAAIDGAGWRFRMDEAGRAYDDIDFINQLITQATAGTALLGTAIDPQQVYVVGESRGAGFAYYLYADPRTRNKVRAIVPISGTFYCDGSAEGEGMPGATVKPGSDVTCGTIRYDYWGPKPELFADVTRDAHILDIHGQNDTEGTEPPVIDVAYGASNWAGWGEAAGCYTVLVSKETERTLPQQVAGQTVKTYAYSQSENDLATRCAGLDLTFYIVQGAGHVPGGFEATAWCFLSSVGGTPSSSACQSAATPSNTPTTSATPNGPTPTGPTATRAPSPTRTTSPGNIRVFLPLITQP